MSSFSADLTKFCQKYDADIKLVIRKITFEAFSRVILRTPVDTGRARANWGVSIGAPQLVYNISAEDKSGTATLAAAANGTQSWKCTGSIFMTNNVPYIGVLEYGRADGSPGSKQSPEGMVRITMEEMQSWIRSMAR
jgi:hypothetical protein